VDDRWSASAVGATTTCFPSHHVDPFVSVGGGAIATTKAPRTLPHPLLRVVTPCGDRKAP